MLTINEWEDHVDSMWRGKDDLRGRFIAAVGLGGETGEVLELLKKDVRDYRLIRDDLILELGDLLFYLTKVAHQHSISLDEVMAGNVDKLRSRYAESV